MGNQRQLLGRFSAEDKGSKYKGGLLNSFYWMEEQYGLAHDWLQNTGEGCSECGKDVKTYVKKLCPFLMRLMLL